MDTSKSISTKNRLNERNRLSLLEKHPIVEREYTLPTPMLMAAYAIIRERVWTRRTGIVFYGSPRIGKTKCAEEVRRLLQIEFPKIHATVAYARRSIRATDSHMFKLILEAFGHALSSRTNPDQLFNNAVTDVELEVIRRKGNQFVLVIDEAQLLNDTDLQQLVVYHNALAAKHIKMTTISFAQPEILHRRTALMAAQQNQIIARFLSEPVQFEGCSGSDDLRKLLEAYDEHSDFPEGSGWSYTRFFLPQAFENGFRLTHYAVPIWQALEKAAGTLLEEGVPVEHVCLTVEYLLLESRKTDAPHFALSDDEISEAVEAANLENFSQVMITDRAR